jgi:hypothetical protein
MSQREFTKVDKKWSQSPLELPTVEPVAIERSQEGALRVEIQKSIESDLQPCDDPLENVP